MGRGSIARGDWRLVWRWLRLNPLEFHIISPKKNSGQNSKTQKMPCSTEIYICHSAPTHTWGVKGRARPAMLPEAAEPARARALSLFKVRRGAFSCLPCASTSREAVHRGLVDSPAGETPPPPLGDLRSVELFQLHCFVGTRRLISPASRLGTAPARPASWPPRCRPLGIPCPA